MAVANLRSGCVIRTSNLQVGTTELGVLFFGDKYCHKSVCELIDYLKSLYI